MERFYASGKRRRLFVDTSYPGSDDRSYRVVKLANGVMAALVSDPTTEKASAALAVKVGAFSDPADVPGLAHFLEHMLFQGTTKYPGASLWKQYVAAHGGSTNAATAGETTCYQFDVVDGAFEGALDRFGRFFHESTLDATCVDREMHAVDAEHSKNLNDDGRRAYQLLRLSANQKHPFSKFSTGSLATLKRDDIRDRLVAFYEANYSPTKMTVGIVSRRPLDELEEL
ncbi:Metalloenzyme, LuxS/M16 peptidase-like protein, partial [Pelagophyceae sp. CCMP2097]